jgi:rhodanese-related sulfurtransferase
MAKYDVISARQARKDKEHNNALLVCAYEDEEKFKKNSLEGAISFASFKKKEDDLAKDREIIFYCS